MKKLTTTLFLFLTIVSVNAQPYKTGIGVRLGGITNGITVKHFTNSNTALEGILSFGRHSFLITGLYEKHQVFPKAEGLTWFYGLGPHVGFFENDYGYDYFYYKSHKNPKVYIYHEDTRMSIGGDFILGLDYKFRNAPVNLSLDVKPFFDFVPGFYGYWEGALSFRFTL